MNQPQTDQPISNSDKRNVYGVVIFILTFPLFMLSVLFHLIGEVVLIPALLFQRIPLSPQLRDVFNIGKAPMVEETTKAQEPNKQGQI
jgi:hypothetical protein